MEATNSVHVFEQAGLGVAPFRFVGAETRTGPLRPIDPRTGQWDGMTEIGAPGQPMGTCQFCGEGIGTVCIIRSADGRTFEVGTTCVEKTGDAGLKRSVAKVVNEARKGREAARVEAAAKLLAESAEVRAALQALPHGNAGMAARGMSLLDSAEWLMTNAGRAGQLRAARMVERAQKVGP